MSLVRELERPGSPLRAFFQGRFPDRATINAEVRERAADLPLTRPSTPVPWGTVGEAIDYRIAFSFQAARALATQWGDCAIASALIIDTTDPRRGPAHLPAELGALALVHNRGFSHELVRSFFLSLRATLNDLSPMGATLELAAEARLCRYCYALGLFDEIARAGLEIRSPLYELALDADVDDLLAIASPASIDDVCRMAELFHAHQPELILGDAVLKPSFLGSAAVGGADADLIVDRCLIDIKATLNPGSISKRSWPWQLLAYVLLDLDDEHEIDSIGLYLARQGLLLRWPADEYASRLAGQPASIAQARDELRQLLRVRGVAA